MPPPPSPPPLEPASWLLAGPEPRATAATAAPQELLEPALWSLPGSEPLETAEPSPSGLERQPQAVAGSPRAEAPEGVEAEAQPSRAATPVPVPAPVRASRPPARSEPDAAPAPEASEGTAPAGEPASQGGDEAGAGVEEADEQGRRRRRPIVLAIALVVLALLIGGGVYYWWVTRNLVSTDDAYTDGRAVTIAPQVAGEVISLDINDNQFVKQGQILIQIDPRQYQNAKEEAQAALDIAKGQYAAQQYAAAVAHKNFPAQLEQAKARLEIEKANLAKAEADYDRQLALRKPATTQQEVDQAATALWQAKAQVKLAEAQVLQNSPVPQLIGQAEAQVKQLKGEVEQAEARLKQAELNLSWTTVKAPQDGWVTRRNVEKGNYVVAGQQILSIVTPEVWVTANFKETQLTRMRPGQPVTIKVDAYPQLDLRGHVDSIQRGSGSRFTAFPPENATGNFVKIVQRVPVKIVIDSGLKPDIPMPLGISVVPTVTVE